MLNLIMTAWAWPGSILSRKNWMHQRVFHEWKLLVEMKSVNHQAVLYRKMGRNSHLTSFALYLHGKGI